MAIDVPTSKLLSLMLRHRPHDFGIVLDDAGWADVAAVLVALASHRRPVNPQELIALVQTSDKQCFALSPDGKRIRANQGHSIPVRLDLGASQPPDRLFHGTVARFLPSIRAKGLLRGRRHHVHLSASREVADAVGRRRGPPVIVEILAGRMADAGLVFLRTANGVWLTDHVPTEFLIFPE